MTYFLGLDQGGTKTTAIVGDECGRILGMCSTFGAVHSIDGMHRAMEASRLATGEALSHAGITYGDLYGIYGGVSGIDWEYERPLVEEAFRREFPVKRVCIINDCLIAMRAATHSPQSAVICAGTGVNCAVRNGEQEIVFGYYIPDSLQGGNAIGMRAVQKVFDAQAGVGEETMLTELLLEYFKSENVDQLLRKYVEKQIPQHEITALPRLVEEAALAGDHAADEVYADFARGIVPYIHAGMRKLGILDRNVDVVLSGSIFKCRAKGLQETVRNCILEKAPFANIIDAEYEPIIGAYLLGLEDYGKADLRMIEHRLGEQKKLYKISRKEWR